MIATSFHQRGENDPQGQSAPEYGFDRRIVRQVSKQDEPPSLAMAWLVPVAKGSALRRESGRF
ncbi:MAG: hypothetical protein Q7S69_07495 [Nitrosomonadaceae bacterium]|nr:hypothetical protein [Nitrosomonadaceae bacterium]